MTRKATDTDDGLRQFLRQSDKRTRKSQRFDSAPTHPLRGPKRPPPAAPVEEGTLEYFAASFLSSVHGASLEPNPEDGWTTDPRVALIASAIRKLGLTRIRRVLGGGSFGVAAEDEDGHVVKLTSDHTEIQAGAVLKAKTLPHVVWIAGAWIIKGVKVTPEWTSDELGIGVLSMEKVEDLRARAETHPMLGLDADTLARTVHRIKKQEGAYPDDLFAMTPGKARLFLRHVSEVMEGEIRRALPDELGHDVAAGLSELRAHGVYAIDVHPGNIGWDETAECFKLFDIGTSSSPDVPKPKVIAPVRPKRIAFEAYAIPEGTPIGEI